AGRRRRDQGARARGRHHPRSADLSAPAGNGGARFAPARSRARHRFSRRGQVRFPARDQRGAGCQRIPVDPKGCDKFCTFCVVPYTRGAEYSRPADAIVAEARRLVKLGAREITLLGQNVNAYHDGEYGLGRLIRSAAEIPGLARIRYTTSHPRDVDDELIEAHRDVEKLMPFLHLPVQSGSDKILDAMNRRHTADDYRRIVDRLRTARPDLALSSDFIAGFPGESHEDFD